MAKATDLTIRPFILTLALAGVPHAIDLNAWIIGWCACLWTYAWLAPARGWPLPSPPLRYLLTFVGIGGILLSAGYRFDSRTYVGLMMVMAALKPLEITSYRDKMMTAFLAYFIVIAKLFIAETLAVTLYMFVSVWITTAVLIRVHQPNRKRSFYLGFSGRLLLKALPLMLILFLLFPRFRDSFWRPGSTRQGRTGFTTTLRLGDVSKLVQDDTVVFRAEFPERVPDPAQLYWRGIVFLKTDGLVWSPDTGSPTPFSLIETKQRLTYIVTLMGTGNRYLFPLDIPVSKPAGTRLSTGYTLRAQTPVVRQTAYRLTSALDYRAQPERPPSAQAARLPATGNPRARKLAAEWRDTLAKPEAVIQAALTYFRSQGFVYTLESPRLADDAVDTFLFDTRRGYCEHFAAAFTFLMRAAGIPCRIVGGYLGGERNPFGNYITVRQSDAHAWTEVWLAEQGWRRIDPTAVIVPERVTRGYSAALAPEELPAPFGLRRMFNLTYWGRQIQFAWEAVGYRWDIWFSGYSYASQRAALERIGLSPRSLGVRIAILLLSVAGILTAIIFGWRAVLMNARVRSGDPVRRLYDEFCKKLAAAGARRHPSQGPLAFGRVAAAAVPGLKTRIAEITHLYIQLRYGKGSNQQDVKRLRELIRRLRIPTKKESAVID